MRYISYTSSSTSGTLQKVAAIMSAVIVAGVTLVFSSVFLAVFVIAAAIGGLALWWKTRHVRRMMREMQDKMNRAREAAAGQASQDPFASDGQFAREEAGQGVVIDGEAVRVDDERDPFRR